MKRDIGGTIRAFGFGLIVITAVATVAWASLRTPRTVSSEPFRIETVEYLQGGFAADTKTIVTADDGRTHVLYGHCVAPPIGTRVVIIREARAALRKFGGDRIKIVGQ